MIKNKTHRIISISPTSLNGCTKNVNNKAATPIKPFQLPTRSNTIKTTIKPDQNQQLVMQQTYKKSVKNDNYIDSVIISSYKDDNLPKNMIKAEGANVIKKDNFHIDEILNRIGKSYENQKNNISNQLLKKTHINELRQHIRQAKLVLKSKQQQNENDPFTCDQTSSAYIETLSHTIKQQISSLFSTIHKQLYKRQKDLYESLQQKIFQLKQKKITKYFQTASLKSYIQTCEADINKNYEGIIQELDIKQLMRIVNSYMKKIQFYTQKIKDCYSLKLSIPDGITQLNFLSNLSINITKIQTNMPVPQVSMFQSEMPHNNKIKNRISLDRSLKLSLSKQSRKLQAQLTNANTNLNTSCKNRQEVQILQLNKIFAKKIKNNKDLQPRISSARGRY